MINHTETWMMSNRQPWPELVLRGLITCKTRSATVTLPPAGTLVYLHASTALWNGWQNLRWMEHIMIDVRNLPRGGVVGVATVANVGWTQDIMPDREWEYFDVMQANGNGCWNCAGEKAIQFDNVQRLPFIPCRGAQVPTRKLPPELQDWIEVHPDVIRQLSASV